MTIPLPPLPDDFRFKGPRKITADQVRAIQREAMRVAIEAAARVLTEHQIPVGNSAAGEIACSMTYDALKECRDNIKSLEFTHHE